MHLIKFFRVAWIGMICFLPISAYGMMASVVNNPALYAYDDTRFQLFLGTSFHTQHGDMTYRIQGKEDGGWKSELEWPIENILYIGEVASLRFMKNFQLNAGFWKSVKDGDGTTKDSDWIYKYYGDVVAVYSETDANVNATEFDMNLRYYFLRRDSLQVGAMFGYAMNKWKWSVGNGYQTTIDPSQYYQGAIPANAATYEEKLYVPYIGITMSSHFSRFGINIYTLYSPVAMCDDEDDHKLRSKLSTGESDGTFLSVGADALWNIIGAWSLTGTLQYAYYDLDGTQDQYFYGGKNPPPGTRFENIDFAVSGSQTSFGLMIGYTF